MDIFWDVFRSICYLFAGIAVFLLGIKFMSNGLDKGAGKSLKKTFVKVGDNRFSNAGIGAGATATIQSSTAVTVMIVGFANAGVITLLQATAMIMGANVGTTFTAFFAVIDNLPISRFFMMIGIVGVPMFLFGKKHKIKIAGEIITGLAILFVGMYLMGNAFPRYNPPTYANPNPSNHPLTLAFRSMFVSISGTPVGPLLLVLIGALFTAIIQSSTAATNMAVIMAGSGVLPLEAGIFIILGANIGTTLTALFAAIGASTNAKRAAIAHLFYNLIGAVVFLPILWPLREPISNALVSMSSGVSEALEISPLALSAAFFHLFYNLALFALLIGLTKPFALLVSKVIPVKAGELESVPKLHFIDSKNTISLENADEGVIQTAKDNVYAEIKNMARLAFENFELAFNTTLVPDISKKTEIISNEQKINFINKEIGLHIVKLEKEKVFEKGDEVPGALHQLSSEIERMGDRAMAFVEEAGEMLANGLKFTAPAVEEIDGMRVDIKNMFNLAMEILESRDRERLVEIVNARKSLGELKRKINFRHITRLNEGSCNVDAGVHFYAVVSNLENVKDNLSNIAFSIRDTKGAQLRDLKAKAKQRIKSRENKNKVYW